MSKKGVPAVGFPPPLLGAEPLRLEILRDAEGWLALDKPAGFGTRAHPWDAEVPDIDAALNVQLEAGKPELVRLGASIFGSAYYLDPEIAGVAVYAKNRDALASIRNAFGSHEGRYVFSFVAGRAPEDATELESDAPLLPHRVKPKMIPSTAKGKKCHSHFIRREVSGDFALWEAHMDFFRAHQVRAHAAVAGIPVLGDSLYAGPEMPSTKSLDSDKRRKGPDRPAYSKLPIWLSEVRLGESFEGEPIRAYPDKYLSRFLQRIGLVQR